jgi:hypothetical protein
MREVCQPASAGPGAVCGVLGGRPSTAAPAVGGHAVTPQRRKVGTYLGPTLVRHFQAPGTDHAIARGCQGRYEGRPPECTTDPAQVTCRRCRAHLVKHTPLPKGEEAPTRPQREEMP